MHELRTFTPYDDEDISLLSNCTLCPRECGADRFKGATGYCGSDAGMNIASICIHRGEEPAISGPEGICNIFFSGCNMRCVFCQNHEISRPAGNCRQSSADFNEAVRTISGILDSGIKAVGFVSPSHVVPQVKALIKALNSLGYKPITVYNTNGYDKKETITGLSAMIDVFLPDYKYITPDVAKEFSDAGDYPAVVLRAVREMYYLKGSVLTTDEEGRAVNGLLVRHLILPGYADESEGVLASIAEELSPGVNISLMSQYYPTPFVKNHDKLGRTLYRNEYGSVVKTMHNLGFRNGWVQDPDSFRNYRPDFRKKDPFHQTSTP